MPRLPLLLGLCLAAGPVLADQPPSATLKPPGEQMRSFSVKNESGSVLQSAQAHMTDGKDRPLTQSPLQPQQAWSVVVPRNECVDSVEAHLKNGRTLRAAHMNDCGATQIVVGDNGIGMQSNVNPRSP